jgi:hypothetical protein
LIWYFDPDGTPLCDACHNRRHGRVLEQRPRPVRPAPPVTDDVPGRTAGGERDAAAADHVDELETSMQRRQSANSPGPAAMDVDSRRESVIDASGGGGEAV